MQGRFFAGHQRKPTSAQVKNAPQVQKEKVVIRQETAQIGNGNVSTMSLTKAKLELKPSRTISRAFVSIKGTTTNPCIFALIIITEIDRHLRDANKV